MQCTILMSNSLANVPLAECGGIVLAAGDKLLVTPALLQSLKAQYGSVLGEVGTIDIPKLKHGSYEYQSGKSKAVEIARVLSPTIEPMDVPLAEVSADKSMIGRLKARRK